MSNQHNPVARKIEQLQARWINATKKNPDYRVIRWMISPEDTALINGFYRLESSPYGKLPDFFLVMLTPFESPEQYSRQFIKDMTGAWENDKTVRTTQSVWELAPFREKLTKGISPDAVLCEILTVFHSRFCRKDQSLVIGILPRLVKNMDAYNDWILEVAEKLPVQVKISLMDDLDKNHHKRVFKHFKEKTISIECRDLNLSGIAREMATEGYATNPEADFRRCIFEMSDAVAAKNQEKVDAWGQHAVGIAQQMGNQNLLATAYLIYAGFYLFLRKEKTEELLDKGILIAENAYKAGDTQVVGVLLQLYGYKSAYYRLKNRKRLAAQWMFKQAQLAADNRMGIYTISICGMAVRLAKTSGEDTIYSDCLSLGYHAGDSLSEEELKSSEIGLLAYYYEKELRSDERVKEADTVRERMRQLFGQAWDEKGFSLSDKAGETIPDIRSSLTSIPLNK